MSPAYLMAVGDGLSIFNIYLTRLRVREALTGKMPQQESVCWELFSYEDAKKQIGRGYLNADDRELEMSLPYKFSQIFTTDIAPFLKGLDYPYECDRVYEIQPSCIGSDKIKIIAENPRILPKGTRLFKFLPANISSMTAIIPPKR